MTIDERMKELIIWLNERTKEYDAGTSTVSDKEWDNKYFELVKLEEENPDIIFGNSPTRCVNFEKVSELRKVEHSHPMLSLEKTKDKNALIDFIASTKQRCIIMPKMDGLTISLTYKNGKLCAAETRGNGAVGEDVIHNARVISSIPLRIPYHKELTIDGEIICTYQDFEPFSDQYANPRNFAAGSLRLLDAAECHRRNLTFVAWAVIENEPYESLSTQLEWLSSCLGFKTVSWHAISGRREDIKEQLESSINYIKTTIEHRGYPIDGFVIKIDDYEAYKDAGITAHHPKGALALKEYDEEVETKLLDIEYTMGKSGVLTPVAIFEPVNLCGSTVSRANMHNLSVMESLLGHPYRNQSISVFKANLIIPQVAGGEIATDEETFIEIPAICPYCGEPTEIIKDDVKTVLKCTNASCGGRINNIIEHYCSKKGMDIKGFGEKVIDFLLEKGWLNDISDLYTLKEHRSEWIKCDGWGIASVDKLLFNILNSRECELPNFLAAIGIPDIGITVAKKICEHVSTYEEFRKMIDEKYDFTQWYGFSFETRRKLINFDYSIADKIYNNYLTINEYKKTEIIESPLNGAKIVITGKLTKFKSRTLAKDYFTKLGCTVTDTVTKSTTFLLNNDKESTTAKNKKAQDLGIPIYTENEIYEKFNLT